MKRNIKWASALAFTIGASILFLSSCKKAEVIPPKNPAIQPSPFSSLDDYLQSKIVSSESFQVTGSAGGTFTTSKGTIITVPANAFISASSQPITGFMTLRIKEVFSNSDMMFAKMFPISNGNVLNSGGEFFIEATQYGNILRVADGSLIEVDIPAQALDAQMELFLAGPIEDLDTSNWVQIDTTLGSGFIFSSVDNSYQLSLDTLGWGNIDAFQSSVSYFDCTFDIIGIPGVDNTNTTAFAIFKNENTVWPVGVLSWGTISNNTIFETHLASAPLNLVVISVVDSQLYYGLVDMTPQQGESYNVVMIETTSSNLDQIIDNLP